MTEPRDRDGLDTTSIDEGWGEEPGVPPSPAGQGDAAVLPPAPAGRDGAVLPPAAVVAPPVPDDEIEFEQDVVARDSMPTFQHPNPLAFDRDPDAEARRLPAVPKPPPLPQLRGAASSSGGGAPASLARPPLPKIRGR